MISYRLRIYRIKPFAVLSYFAVSKQFQKLLIVYLEYKYLMYFIF